MIILLPFPQLDEGFTNPNDPQHIVGTLTFGPLQSYQIFSFIACIFAGFVAKVTVVLRSGGRTYRPRS